MQSDGRVVLVGGDRGMVFVIAHILATIDLVDWPKKFGKKGDQSHSQGHPKQQPEPGRHKDPVLVRD